jgi:hypothetical protein
MANGLLPEDHYNWNLLLMLGAKPSLRTAITALDMTDKQRKRKRGSKAHEGNH